MPLGVYVNLENENRTFLSKELKTFVYHVFCMYESWKIIEGAYDFMDVVNYILEQIILVYIIILKKPIVIIFRKDILAKQFII